MCDSNDNWPMPDYSVGPTKHLHAVGVITTLYNSFESSVSVFFRHHLDLLKVPQKVTEFMFHELNEQKRLEALGLVFTNCEKDPDTLAVILNLLEYFQWCWDARNKLAHAEHYPKSFGRLTDELNLTKQISKRNPTRGYITLDLATLRDIANKINRGIRQAARLHNLPAVSGLASRGMASRIRGLCARAIARKIANTRFSDVIIHSRWESKTSTEIVCVVKLTLIAGLMLDPLISPDSRMEARGSRSVQDLTGAVDSRTDEWIFDRRGLDQIDRSAEKVL
jgi:hypothetical protein